MMETRQAETNKQNIHKTNKLKYKGLYITPCENRDSQLWEDQGLHRKGPFSLKGHISFFWSLLY